ncbi:MAG: cobalamin biosynthesis protein [Pseudomonadota bacterium]
MIVAGFGCRSRATADSLASALRATGHGAEVEALASLSDKVKLTAFRALADRLGLPVIALDDARLAQVETATHSTVSLVARGTGSVAEASALVAAGSKARLLAPRVVSGDRLATCAIAIGEGS